MAWIEFRVIGFTPLPKQSFRASSKGGGYTSPRIKEWQETVAWYAKEAMIGRDMLDGDLGVMLYFVRDNRIKVDFDNLSKAALDAMNGIVYKDDKVCVDGHIHKRFGEVPGLYVRVWEVSNLFELDIQSYSYEE